MADEPCPVLVLDDGELDDLVALLGELRLAYRRLRGAGADVRLEPPMHLLVATPRRAGLAPAGSQPDAPPGRPLRVVSVEEDSNAMRAMLRRQGFDLLVRRPTHREVWRLLVERALYQGDERRAADRVPVGSAVALESDDVSAVLIDVSNRGCHLLLRDEVPAGGRVSFEIPPLEEDAPPLRLSGEVVRSATRGSHAYSVGVLFDRALSEDTRGRLGALLNAWTRGDASLGPTLVEAGGELPPLPPCESPAIPGLTLDDETDPAVSAQVTVGLQQAGGERRTSPRASFSQSVQACGPRRSAVLLGRDLSAGGMRVEPLPDLAVGDRFEVAIYGPNRPDPFRIQSEVIRDDGAEGLALVFHDVSPELARELEKLVACLPDVEPLQNGELGTLGSVIGEVVSGAD